MAKYKKRPDGRYATSFIIGHNTDGKTLRRTLYGRTIMELDKKVADFKSLQNKGIVVGKENITVREWAQTWLKLYKSNREYNTYIMYENSLNTHILPAIGDMPLTSVKKHNLQQLLNSLVDQGKMRTAEIVRLTLRQLFNQALEQDYIYKSITNGLTLPKRPKPKKRALTDEEVKSLQAADFNAKERAFVNILYYTGLRRSEALALTVNDIDLDNKTLTVCKDLIFKVNVGEIKSLPKSDAGNRTLPLPAPLCNTLSEYLSQIDNKYLFTAATNNNLMSKSSLRRFWDGIIKKLAAAYDGQDALADDIAPHIFRHTYATNLYKAGIDIKTAQYLLGHASIQMTMDIYTHLDDSKIITSEQKLNSFFDGKNKCSDSQNIVSAENQ